MDDRANAFRDSIDERVDRFNSKRTKKYLKLQAERSRLEDKASTSTSWLDTMVSNYNTRLDKRAEFIKNTQLPKAQNYFMTQQLHKFEKAVRNGFSVMTDMGEPRISLNNPKYAYAVKNGTLHDALVKDFDMVDSLTEWLSLDANKKIRQERKVWK